MRQFVGLNQFYNVDGMFINYTKVSEVTNDKYNLSPRKQFCGASLGSDYGSLRSRYDDIWLKDYEKSFIRTKDGLTTLTSAEQIYNKGRSYPYNTCLMLMDTDREREINLAPKYNFSAMTEG